MITRPYENNLKLLLIKAMAESGLTLDESLVAYAWFDHYYLQFDGDGKKAFEEVRARVLRRLELDQMPPSSRSSSVIEGLARRIKNWLA